MTDSNKTIIKVNAYGEVRFMEATILHEGATLYIPGFAAKLGNGAKVHCVGIMLPASKIDSDGTYNPRDASAPYILGRHGYLIGFWGEAFGPSASSHIHSSGGYVNNLPDPAIAEAAALEAAAPAVDPAPAAPEYIVSRTVIMEPKSHYNRIGKIGQKSYYFSQARVIKGFAGVDVFREKIAAIKRYATKGQAEGAIKRMIQPVNSEGAAYYSYAVLTVAELEAEVSNVPTTLELSNRIAARMSELSPVDPAPAPQNSSPVVIRKTGSAYTVKMNGGLIAACTDREYAEFVKTTAEKYFNLDVVGVVILSQPAPEEVREINGRALENFYAAPAAAEFQSGDKAVYNFSGTKGECVVQSVAFTAAGTARYVVEGEFGMITGVWEGDLTAIAPADPAPTTAPALEGLPALIRAAVEEYGFGRFLDATRQYADAKGYNLAANLLADAQEAAVSQPAPGTSEIVGYNLDMAIYRACGECKGTGKGRDGYFCSTCQARHYDGLKEQSRLEDLQNEADTAPFAYCGSLEGDDAATVNETGTYAACLSAFLKKTREMREMGFKVVAFNPARKAEFNGVTEGADLFQKARFGGGKQATYWIVNRQEALRLSLLEDA